jgi:hypothetical protein
MNINNYNYNDISEIDIDIKYGGKINNIKKIIKKNKKSNIKKNKKKSTIHDNYSYDEQTNSGDNNDTDDTDDDDTENNEEDNEEDKKSYNKKNTGKDDNSDYSSIDDESYDDDNDDDDNDDDDNEGFDNYEYPDLNDPELQLKLYKKREFYYYKTPDRPDLNDYSEIEKYRDKVCNPTESLPHQNLLSNFINPNTPYKGILCFHGTGTGKCVTAETIISINNVNSSIKNVWEIYKSDDIIIENNSNTCIPNRLLYTKSYNIKTKNIECKKVDYLYRELVNTTLMKIKLENNLEIIKTFSHKLYTCDGWKTQLCESDYVLCYKDNLLSYSKIIKVDIIKHNDYVYDIEVNDFHNFI